jgi:hypothetical protein
MPNVVLKTTKIKRENIETDISEKIKNMNLDSDSDSDTSSIDTSDISTDSEIEFEVKKRKIKIEELSVKKKKCSNETIQKISNESPLSDIKMMYIPTKTLETKTYVFIPVFIGKTFCKKWYNQFSEEILNINNLSLKNNDFVNHYDVFPISFGIFNDTLNLEIKNDSKVEVSSDIIVKVSSDISYVIRLVSREYLKEFKKDPIINIRFVPHFSNQRNIYLGKNVVNSLLSWNFNCIINSMKYYPDKILKIKHKNKIIKEISLLSIYISLYSYYSQQR